MLKADKDGSGMKKIFLFLLMTLTINAVASASAISGPQISVVAQVAGAGIEKRATNDGKAHDEAYIDFRILSVAITEPGLMDYSNCPVKKGEVYRVIDNYRAVLKPGDKIKAGIEFVSSMGPDGPVNFLQWSPVTYEDASPVKAKDGLTVTYFQGSF